MFDDGDTDHILLETGHYKLVETGTSSGGKSKSSNGSKSKTEAPAEVDRSSCQQAMSRHKQHMSGPSAAGSDKERERDKGSKSATREMRDKSAKQQQQQHQASSNSTHGAAAGADSKADAVDSRAQCSNGAPESKAGADTHSDRKATAAVAASDGRDKRTERDGGGAKGTGGGPVPAASGAAKHEAAAAAAGGHAGPVKKLPLLNMSHVSKKDREAARMLLGFSTPSSTEVSSLTLHSPNHIMTTLCQGAYKCTCSMHQPDKRPELLTS